MERGWGGAVLQWSSEGGGGQSCSGHLREEGEGGQSCSGHLEEGGGGGSPTVVILLMACFFAQRC